jgi:hypothetical protein
LENTYKKLFENEEAISCVDPTKYRYAATQQPATSSRAASGVFDTDPACGVSAAIDS